MELKKGFSLVELTIVIGLIALLTLAISAIMLTSIGTSNRIRTATRVKQTGSFVIDQMQSILRSAKSIESCSTSTSSISVINQDGTSNFISSSNNRIALNVSDYLTPANISVTNFQLVCEPTDTEPSLIKIAFDLKSSLVTIDRESPTLHFETSINLRNQ